MLIGTLAWLAYLLCTFIVFLAGKSGGGRVIWPLFWIGAVFLVLAGLVDKG